MDIYSSHMKTSHWHCSWCHPWGNRSIDMTWLHDGTWVHYQNLQDNPDSLCLILPFLPFYILYLRVMITPLLWPPHQLVKICGWGPTHSSSTYNICRMPCNNASPVSHPHPLIVTSVPVSLRTPQWLPWFILLVQPCLPCSPLVHPSTQVLLVAHYQVILI